MNVPTLNELADFTLEGYVKLLNYLDQKYTIVPFCKLPAKDIPYLILRHDIDASPSEALRMAQIERDLNIKSTYFVLFSGSFYNVLEGDNIDVLKQISELGHEIGLHYYPTQYRRYNQNPVKTLKLEIQLLEHLLNKKIYSISRHGPWDRDPFTRIKKYINANHPYIRGDLFVHDSDRTWTTLQGLVTLLNNSPKRVQLLVHPENWQEDKIDRVALLERHFHDLKKKNSLLKKEILEYFKTEKLIIDYDSMITKNKTENFNNPDYLDVNNQNKIQITVGHCNKLIRYYLLNTTFGWTVKRINTKAQHTIQKLGEKLRF